MTPVEIRCEENRLVFTDEAAQVFGQSRPLEDRDLQRFQDWADRYRLALGERDPAAALVAIGREMYFWLNGGELWLEQSRQLAASPWKLEFAVPPAPNDNEQCFLDAPWELLADADGHLAARRDVVFCPIRRVGKRTKPLAPSPYRLSMVFMAAAPRGVPNLQFEQEEAAILQAAGSVGIDLAVEETGTLKYLGDCWTDEVSALQGPPDVLHISCHGAAKPVPSLIFENDEGRPDPVSAGELKKHLRGGLPRLLFLSACETAVPDEIEGASPLDVLGSLAVAMLRQGVPATLGWAGSVRDVEASRFAQEIYQRLAGFEELEAAVAQGRLEMLNPSVQQPGQLTSRDWHLARLYLGPQGGGKLCSSKRVRRQRDPLHAQKAFLNEREKAIPVAGRYEFVGRRRQIQQILSEFREGRGVLIHGLGRQGKSSLASRIATRMQDHVVIVLFGNYDAITVLQKIKSATGSPEVAEIVERYLPSINGNAAALELALSELLQGPCRQSEPPTVGTVQRRPFLLIADDFEQGLDPAAGALHRVKPNFVLSVGAVLKAFRHAETNTESRLLFTSRFKFTLPDGHHDLADYLVTVPLPSMDQAERRKQLVAKLRSLGADQRLAHDERSDRILRIGGSSPGLQDRLLTLSLDSPEACDQALDEMEQYLVSGQAPNQQALREFLENLALDKVLALLSAEEHNLLRASMVFALPVPFDVLSTLARQLGDATAAGHDPVARLQALGLWEMHEDPFDPRRDAALVHALARGKIAPLPDVEQIACVALVLNDLLRAWGGPEARRSGIVNLELTRLALVARNLDVLQATAEATLYFLENQFEYRNAAKCARQVVEAFDAGGRQPPPGLLKSAGERCAQVGDVAAARDYFSRAVQHYETASARGEPVDQYALAAALISHGRQLKQDGRPQQALEYFQRAEKLLQDPHHHRERAVVLGEIARILVDRGQVEAGLKLHHEQVAIFEALGDSRARAVALGDIARILVSRGQFEAALNLHQEELAVYESLGDERSRAVALGDIARILASCGQVDVGLKLQRERLHVNQALGDEDGRAAALYDIARIMLIKGDRAEALECLKESYAIVVALGRLDGICFVGLFLGALLIQAGGDDAASAREMLTRARDGFQQLGRPDLAQRAEELLRRLDGTA